MFKNKNYEKYMPLEIIQEKIVTNKKFVVENRITNECQNIFLLISLT